MGALDQHTATPNHPSPIELQEAQAVARQLGAPTSLTPWQAWLFIKDQRYIANQIICSMVKDCAQGEGVPGTALSRKKIKNYWEIVEGYAPLVVSL